MTDAAGTLPVVVTGAGMAGLFTALALGSAGREVILLERDPPAPEGGADVAFDSWNRRGAGHLRHSHAFLARLRSILVTEYPDLLTELREAGCQELGFADSVPKISKDRYRPRPEDADLTVLTSRRTTLELVMRRHVEAMDHVTIRSGLNVAGLLSDPDAMGRPVVRGVRVTGADGEQEIAAEIVIDAGGRMTSVFDWLGDLGVTVPEESESAGILYFTRHWRLRPGQTPPERGAAPAAGDLGFIKYGVFPADNGCFSVTLAVPEVETDLRQAVLRPELFDRICGLLPGVAPWTDPERSDAVSKVYGMGDLVSRWRDMAPEDWPKALNLFVIGDGLVRTNPLYGRGCSFAAVEAHLLRDVLAATDDPFERAKGFQRAVNTQLRPFYEDMRGQDRAAIRRAKHALNPEYRPKLKARLLKSFAEDGIGVALRSDPDLLRDFMRGFHMLEPSRAWLKKPGNMTKVLKAWMGGRRRNARFYPPSLGPGRKDMLGALGLAA